MLKKVRKTYQLAIGLTTFLALMTAFLPADQRKIALWLIIGLMIACIIFLVTKWKCPHCGRMLPTQAMRHVKKCPHCKMPLDN